MPVNRIRASGRASAAVAAIMAMSTLVGGVWYVARPGEEKMPAAVALAAETLVRPWEGTELRAYLDRIAKPPVLTICGGDTKNVKPGMVETQAGCTKRLMGRLQWPAGGAQRRGAAGRGSRAPGR